MWARAGIMGLLFTLLSATAFVTTEAAAQAASRAAAQAMSHAAAKSAAQAVTVGATRAIAAATVRQVDTSPSAPIVALAPVAVSVTFSDRIASDGASLRIYGPDGEVSAAQAEIVGNAIRRPLDKNVPSGRFEVQWTAQSPAGEKLSGSFSFVAARGHGDVPGEPSGEPSAEATEETGEPSAEPSVEATAEPTEASAEPGSAPGGMPGSGAGIAGPPIDQAAGTALSGEFMVVPIALGAALVLASAIVGLISSSRRQMLVMHRGLALPWQRHQQ